jgi:hypothetical protein
MHLNDHLFVAMERLNDEDLKGKALTEEINRSKAVALLGREIISNGNLVLKARIAVERDLLGVGPVPSILSIGE